MVRKPIGPRKKTALVLSGGATKAGAFHLGVARALKENGFQFLSGTSPKSAADTPPRTRHPREISTYVGSSAGSIISAFLASGHPIEEIIEAFTAPKQKEKEKEKNVGLARLTYQKLFKLHPWVAKDQLSELLLAHKLMAKLLKGDWGAFLQFKWIRATGLFSTLGIEEYLREKILPSNNFAEFLPEIFIVASQLNHSRKVVFGKYSGDFCSDEHCLYDNSAKVSEACAASSSIPLLYAPFEIKNSEGKPTYYIDGELRDTLSTHIALDAGADLVIASYTHQPYHLTEKVGSLTDHGLSGISIQTLYLMLEQKIRTQISYREKHLATLDAIDRYCKDNDLPEKHRKALGELLEEKLKPHKETEVIYIHPNPDDSIFFREHFSLSAPKLLDIVDAGYRAAKETLAHYDLS